MSRTLVLCALAVAGASVLLAQAPAQEKKETPAQGNPKVPTRTVVALTVDATPEPKPALRYTLLPELRDVNPGNPVLGYTKCFGEQNNFFYNKTSVANREKWQTMPLGDLPLKELQNYGGAALRQADYAARLDTPDWQVLLKLKSEGVYLLLPDIQQLRMLAAALKVRFRAEVAEKRFDAALRTAQTMFSLSRHLGDHPTLIGELVGMAVSFVAIGPLEEMIAQPGCPNLYWALTDLPRPLIDLRKGMQGERMFLEVEFAPFDKTTPLSEAELDAVATRLDRLFRDTHLQEGLAAPNAKPSGKSPPRQEPKTPSAWLRAHARDKTHLEASRKRLVESGLGDEVVKKLPARQVILLDEKRTYEIQRDDTLKWANVPWIQAQAVLNQPVKRPGLFSALLPAISRVMMARARLEQRFALLRHVEAIRLYAAAHGGRVPASLTDIEVPLPLDPFSGKAFNYKVEGKKAFLSGTAPRGMEKSPAFNVHYEVSIR